MQKIIWTSGLTVLLLAAADAMAQEAPVRRACAADLQQHCAGVEPGEGRLRDCVQQNFAAFSEPCKQMLLSNIVVVRACREDVQKTCPGIQPGGGRIQACMKDHFAEYSESCKRAIIAAKLGRR
jgi:Cysteine rich repeat